LSIRRTGKFGWQGQDTQLVVDRRVMLQQYCGLQNDAKVNSHVFAQQIQLAIGEPHRTRTRRRVIGLSVSSPVSFAQQMRRRQLLTWSLTAASPPPPTPLTTSDPRPLLLLRSAQMLLRLLLLLLRTFIDAVINAHWLAAATINIE